MWESSSIDGEQRGVTTLVGVREERVEPGRVWVIVGVRLFDLRSTLFSTLRAESFVALTSEKSNSSNSSSIDVETTFFSMAASGLDGGGVTSFDGGGVNSFDSGGVNSFDGSGVNSFDSGGGIFCTIDDAGGSLAWGGASTLGEKSISLLTTILVLSTMASIFPVAAKESRGASATSSSLLCLLPVLSLCIRSRCAWRVNSLLYRLGQRGHLMVVMLFGWTRACKEEGTKLLQTKNV